MQTGISFKTFSEYDKNIPFVEYCCTYKYNKLLSTIFDERDIFIGLNSIEYFHCIHFRFLREPCVVQTWVLRLGVTIILRVRVEGPLPRGSLSISLFFPGRGEREGLCAFFRLFSLSLLFPYPSLLLTTVNQRSLRCPLISSQCPHPPTTTLPYSISTLLRQVLLKNLFTKAEPSFFLVSTSLQLFLSRLLSEPCSSAERTRRAPLRVRGAL